MDTNKFWKICTKILNVILLGCIWLTCCLPIFTIGPSSCSLFSSIRRIINNEEFEVFKYFFSCFKKYFKKTSIFSLIYVVLIALIIYDFLYYAYGKETIDIIGQVVMIMMVIILLGSLINGFARYIDNESETLKEMFLNSIKMSLKCPIETLMVVLITIFIPVGLFLLMPELIMLSFGLCAYLNWLILPRSLQKYKLNS